MGRLDEQDLQGRRHHDSVKVLSWCHDMLFVWFARKAKVGPVARLLGKAHATGPFSRPVPLDVREKSLGQRSQLF